VRLPDQGCGPWAPGPWYLEGHTAVEYPDGHLQLLRPYPNQR
jgi:hypothetical protein